jgi:hypothetical protein
MPDSFGLGYFYPPMRVQSGKFAAYISARRFAQLLRREHALEPGRPPQEETEPTGPDERSREQEPPPGAGE